MLEIKYTAIVEWPGELLDDEDRLRGPFTATWGKTRTLLERELRHLEATNVIFQVGVHENDIRLDGGVKAGRVWYHPGVILTFDSPHGPLSYHTDQYEEFSTNVRAIALALEALRAVDRYGVNKRGSQYTGYKRLAAAGETGDGRKRITTDEEAAAFIAKHFPEVTVEQLLASSWLFEASYKNAARKLHPDNQESGDDDAFVDLQDAAALLKQRHAKSE
ncbi:MAG: hypothetical protein AABN33_18280 [Acidobacteriota bacterium]